jgi:ferredoxin-NADP reductase
MKAIVGELRLRGVAPERIHFELFGPADELLEAA